MIKYCGFRYDHLTNIGDQIQSLAVEQFLPGLDIRINRDSLSKFQEKEQHLLVMNGWFSHTPNLCFPVHEPVCALFWGFHVTDWNNTWEYVLRPESIAYLKRHEPIGCRDLTTMECFRESGINAFYSKCLTLTFPKRASEPKDGWNILVDAQHLPIPNHILKESISVSHKVPNNLPEKVKFIYARYLLNLYKENAKLVITTRLHCALPCIAMGIPVVFFGDESDYRISLLKDMGLKINHITIKNKTSYASEIEKDEKFDSMVFQKNVNWNAKPLDFEKEKSEMIKTFKQLLAAKANLIL